MITTVPAVPRTAFALASLFVCLLATAHVAPASEVGQGTFHLTLSEHPVHCSAGNPITTEYTDTFVFDDKTFLVNQPPGNHLLTINLSLLGPFASTGVMDCVFDEGGTFEATSTNEAGDFQWTVLNGEYLDHVPDIHEGDPSPFVGSVRCTTTRTDDFRALCDGFEFSFNGLSKALAPRPDNAFHDFAGHFTLRTAARVAVDPSGTSAPEVRVDAPVDEPAGAIPNVSVTFRNGVLASGELAIATLADAHGSVPPGLDFPVRGTTEIDHGDGPIPLFEGGDERFVDLSTTAGLPATPSIEVCLPMPAFAQASEVRPVYVLHGEGADPRARRFVDRTSRIDLANGTACAAVAGFSKFAVVTGDVCGNGQKETDGLLTIAAGLRARKAVIVDGLTDCALYPANLPRGLARYCVPDSDAIAGQCTIALRLGINRAGCNRTATGTPAYSPFVDVTSYSGFLRHRSSSIDLTALFGPPIAALINPVDALVGPVGVALPAARKITTYRLRHELSGASPRGNGTTVRDRDVAVVRCLDPARF